MPKQPIHIATSVPAGALFAYHKAPENNELNRLLETAGGGLGGFLGGILPDRFDPPTHPGHRGLAHGLIPVAAGASVWAQNLNGWQQSLRIRADEYARLRAQATDPLLLGWYVVAETALRLLCGVLAGFGAGYVTHVALDFTTPRCLPLIS